MKYTDLYLDDENVERDLGIQFNDNPQIIKARMDRLHSDLEMAHAYLGGELVPDIVVPPKGFLIKALTEEQKVKVNVLLAEKYAFHHIPQQQILLQNVKIDECGEEMVFLPDILKKRGAKAEFSAKPFHEACGVYAHKPRIPWLRNAVAHKIAEVTYALNAIDVRPHFEDCYRPPEVQSGLYLRRLIAVARVNREWDLKTVKTIASSFTASIPGLAGHQAGAAIDLRFANFKNKMADVGNDYPEGSVIACMDCPYVTADQFSNRQLFVYTMRWGGFKLLDTENWHGSHGDRGLGIDGTLTTRKAIYGPLINFTETGDIEPYKPHDVDIPHLTDMEVDIVMSLAREENPQLADDDIADSLKLSV